MAWFWQFICQAITMDSLKEKIEEIEREEIIKALKECNWVLAKTARKLGITERIIGYKDIIYGGINLTLSF